MLQMVDLPVKKKLGYTNVPGKRMFYGYIITLGFVHLIKYEAFLLRICDPDANKCPLSTFFASKSLKILF